MHLVLQSCNMFFVLTHRLLEHLALLMDLFHQHHYGFVASMCCKVLFSIVFCCKGVIAHTAEDIFLLQHYFNFLLSIYHNWSLRFEKVRNLLLFSIIKSFCAIIIVIIGFCGFGVWGLGLGFGA